jgi:hypothetical protein
VNDARLAIDHSGIIPRDRSIDDAPLDDRCAIIATAVAIAVVVRGDWIVIGWVAVAIAIGRVTIGWVGVIVPIGWITIRRITVAIPIAVGRSRCSGRESAEHRTANQTGRESTAAAPTPMAVVTTVPATVTTIPAGATPLGFGGVDATRHDERRSREECNLLHRSILRYFACRDGVTPRINSGKDSWFPVLDKMFK